MKKWLSILFMVCVFCSVFSIQIFGASVTTLQYYDWQLTEEPAGTIIRQAIKDFEAENPNIKVNVLPVPTAQRSDKLATMIFGGQAPDISHVTEVDLARLVNMRALVGLDGYLAKTPDLSKQLIPSMVNMAKYKKKVYGIPRFASINTLMYNKQHFIDAGLDPNKPPVTWAEFLQYAKKLTRDTNNDGKIDRWGFALLGAKTLSLPNRYLSWLWSTGGDILNKSQNKCTLNSKGSIAAIKFYTDLSLVHHVTPPGPADFDYAAMTASFIQEKTSMMVDGPWILGRITAENPSIKVGVGAMPSQTGKFIFMNGGGGFLTIAAQSKNREAAWKLIQFLSNAKNQWDYDTGASALPTRLDLVERMQKSGSPIMGQFSDLCKYVRTAPQIPQMPQIFSLFAEEVQFVLIGQKSAEEAGQNLAKRVDELLNR